MFWSTVVLSLQAIRRNVLRSFLTILGIIIGVGAVITMVTIGGGATVQVKQQLASMGNNLLMVSPGKRQGPGQASGAAPFKLADVDAIANQVSNVVAVAPNSSQGVTAVFSNQNWSTSVSGTSDQFFKVTNRTIRQGRNFNESEEKAGAAVCIIGETVRTNLFGRQEALGSRIRLKKLSCQVVGILEEKGQASMGMDQDDIVVMPIRTFQRRIAGNQDVGAIQVSVRDGASTEKAQAEITRLLRERRHLVSGEEDNFHVFDTKEIARMMTSTTKVLTALLSAVAAISLLVGGIGIMNIMLVSVTERTREIGVRLAIGALEGEVLMQFLIEAVVLSSLGGLLGVMSSLSGCVVFARVLGVPFVFNGGIVAIAFLFSAAVGVIFGYFPALKAARLDPIEALRNE